MSAESLQSTAQSSYGGSESQAVGNASGKAPAQITPSATPNKPVTSRKLFDEIGKTAAAAVEAATECAEDIEDSCDVVEETAPEDLQPPQQKFKQQPLKLQTGTVHKVQHYE